MIKHNCFAEHEQLHHFYSKELELLYMIAVHNTKRGPSVGGIRIKSGAFYDEALEDVLRLSEAMTYKSALAGVSCGGGKSVILPLTEKPVEKNEAFYKFIGQSINSLGGDYIGAEDMGTDEHDVQKLKEYTSHVSGEKNPAIYTAYGVDEGIRFCLNALEIPIEEATIVIQGVGEVGSRLVHLLHDANHLFCFDIDEERLQHITRRLDRNNTIAIREDEVYTTKCHVFAPCAGGDVIGYLKIPNAKIICGAANNPIEKDYSLQRHWPGYLYAPDFVVNSGGIISAAITLQGKQVSEEHNVRFGDSEMAQALSGAEEKIRETVRENLKKVFFLNQRNPTEAAMYMARLRLS
jgi:leucine dehydrogenase